MSLATENLDDAQKRRLRALRRTYRAEKVEIKNDGWALEIVFQDGSKEVFDAKKIKLKLDELRWENKPVN